jgi:TetR/AcrR family transcriptional repressor of nem operon
MEETFERVVESAREGGIEAFIRFYLRPSHREQLRRIVSHIASLLPTPNVEVAQAIFAMLVGTLQLARAVSDPALSDQLLKAGQDAALLLAKYKS